MKTIWKYTLEVKTAQTIKLPVGAEILSIKNQNDNICLYAMVDGNEEETEVRTILIFGTGHAIPENINVAEFLDTVSLRNGLLMFHVFNI